MKKSNILPGENRHAIRLTWKRPVYILTPVKKPAQSINVSSSGILITTLQDDHFQVGEKVTISIPHAITRITTIVSGNIVRMTQHDGWVQLAIELIT